ncbi:MAG: SDR family oxidoreductase [bacterium]
MNLTDKTILVTGATGGIGSVLAQKLFECGAHLILLGRNSVKLDALGQKLQATTYACDLSSPSSRQQVLAQIIASHRQLDILINNAGIGLYTDLPEISDQDWYSSYELNVHAPLILSRDLMPLLEKSPDSLVVNIGSLAGVIPKPGRSTYNSTKFALRGLTLCLAQEYAQKNPHFVHIALDSVLTEFGPWSMKEKLAKQHSGKVYLTPDWTATTLLAILESDTYSPEHVLSYTNYGFGEWHQP